MNNGKRLQFVIVQQKVEEQPEDIVTGALPLLCNDLCVCARNSEHPRTSLNVLCSVNKEPESPKASITHPA